MTTANPQGAYASGNSVANGPYVGEATPRRLSTETKASFKTTINVKVHTPRQYWQYNTNTLSP